MLRAYVFASLSISLVSNRGEQNKLVTASFKQREEGKLIMRKFNVIAAVLGLGLGFAAAAPAAHAVNFIPQQEGEVLTDLDYLDGNAATNIDTSDLGFSVTSLKYNDDYGLSRLFVDKKGTANDYGFGISFNTKDAGTNEANERFMFRSVAYKKDGTLAEKGGELEVGRFRFDFDRAYDKIVLDLFDIEAAGFTGILEVNGQSIEDMLLDVVPGSEPENPGNNTTQQLTLTNVNSFVLQLGQPKVAGFSTGDGVNLSGIQSVPEPTTTFSLGALAVAGMFGVKKRKNIKKSAI